MYEDTLLPVMLHIYQRGTLKTEMHAAFLPEAMNSITDVSVTWPGGSKLDTDVNLDSQQDGGSFLENDD